MLSRYFENCELDRDDFRRAGNMGPVPPCMANLEDRKGIRCSVKTIVRCARLGNGVEFDKAIEEAEVTREEREAMKEEAREGLRDDEKCVTCGGAGHILADHQVTGENLATSNCDHCKGSGRQNEVDVPF